MKKFILGTTLGILLGAGALTGIAQIPDVRDFVLRQDTNTSTSSDTLRKENSTLKTQVDSLSNELSSIKTQLSDKESALIDKEDQVQSLTAERDELQTKLATAEEERDTYKDLVGVDNVTLSQTVVTLTTQLSEKKTELETATAELEQLKVDKETLIARVSELETQLAEAQEKLKGYESLDNIETLDISNYEGKWYLDGEFKDYYIIDNGVVTHNASEDTGVIQCLNNQVYLFMNTAGSEPINLSVDGLSFEKSDGSTYKKFYTNTDTAVVKSASYIAGTYSLESKSITINGDNTLSMSDGENTYYGAYTFTSSERNIGGNKNITSVVSANINTEDGQVAKTFTISSKYKSLEYDGEVYAFVQSEPVLLWATETDTPGYNDSDGYSQVVVRLSEPIFISPGESVSFKFFMYHYGSYGSTYYFKFNGVTFSKYIQLSSTLYSFDQKICNFTGSSICSDTFVIQFLKSVTENLFDIVSIDNVPVVEIIEASGNGFYSGTLLSSVKSYTSTSSSSGFITCSTASDYTDGIYNLTDKTISITGNSAIITPTDGEEISASTCDIVAKTDGYDIYHTATITYVTTELVEEEEVETTHTLVIEYKNNTVTSATLDGENTDITKN